MPFLSQRNYLSRHFNHAPRTGSATTRVLKDAMSPSCMALSSLSRRFRARNNQAVPQIRPRVPQKRPSLSGGLGKESSMDWLTTIDASKALYNVHIDILGDWDRDPWSWAELDWVVKKAPEILSASLNERGSRRAVPLDVPKENFAIRPALLLASVDP